MTARVKLTVDQISAGGKHHLLCFLNINNDRISSPNSYDIIIIHYRATAEAVAAPKTKRDRVAELHYITSGARNVEDPNFEVS